MLRSLGFSLAALLAFGTPAPASAGDLSVVFIDPVSFTDATYSRWFTDDKARAAVLLGLEQHLQRLAERGLAPGDSLRIEVFDVQLAGGFDPFRSGSAGEAMLDEWFDQRIVATREHG